VPLSWERGPWRPSGARETMRAMEKERAGRGKQLLAVLGAGASLLYILNPGMGIFELLPDNLPFVGNLDEAAATGLLFACLRALRRKPAAGTPLAPAPPPRVQVSPPKPAGVRPNERPPEV
jgi:hypothetical protein